MSRGRSCALHLPGDDPLSPLTAPGNCDTAAAVDCVICTRDIIGSILSSYFELVVYPEQEILHMIAPEMTSTSHQET